MEPIHIDTTITMARTHYSFARKNAGKNGIKGELREKTFLPKKV